MERAQRVRAEFLPGQIINQAVRIAVATDFVAGGGDIPDEFRVTLSNPPQHKKRSFYIPFFKDFQCCLELVPDSRWQHIPLFNAK
jgi:hypothetical protein